MATEKTERRLSLGTCSLCSKVVAKGQMTRHLAVCAPAHEETTSPGKGPAPKLLRLLHLVVEGRGIPEYWLHIDIPATARLSVLDSFLRDIWLECCGHLSQFTIGEDHFSAQKPDFFWGRPDRSMGTPIGDVVTKGDRFVYEYDFGTTSELTLRIVAERMGYGVWNNLRLLARNDPPDFRCCVCAKPATQVCQQCIYYEPDAWYCDDCTDQHKCADDDLWMPVVNSPRVGMCGYTG